MSDIDLSDDEADELPGDANYCAACGEPVVADASFYDAAYAAVHEEEWIGQFEDSDICIGRAACYFHEPESNPEPES